MKQSSLTETTTKLSLSGLIITLGIVYGDLGTSPLYTMRAILNGATAINEQFILGALSCVFWTLTLQTTVKYIIITLRADNKGEGGIFSLFALIRTQTKWGYIVAIIGGCALLADGIITPAITVTTAIEGLKFYEPEIPVIKVVLIIIAFLFLIQQFGTSFLGKSFGPVMLGWFSMLAILGIYRIIEHPLIFKALNPYYAVKLLTEYPNGFVLLGAVFLCTTGAEALYSDLGHCGIANIRMSWIFVKSSLILNYFGQGAWILNNSELITPKTNPFFDMMPQWFLLPGIILATAAAIIASQALISGSFTIISEAISLNFFPKIRIHYPTSVKGQMYIPMINSILFLGCCFVVLHFRESSGMEAAYGLSITIAMLMTSILLMIYLRDKIPHLAQILIGLIFFTIEISFLAANLTKFSKGGWISILIAGIFIVVMYVWHKGRKIKNSFITFVKIKCYLPVIDALSKDKSVPKFATNLVYITHANNSCDIENKIIYSILRKQPKRADVYWLLHVDIVDDPHVTEYEVHQLIPGVLIRIDIRLGFKVQPKVNLFFHQIVRDLALENQIDKISHYPSLREFDILSDFRFIVIDRVKNNDYEFESIQKSIMDLYFIIRKIGITEVKTLGLDATNVSVEEVPLLAFSEISDIPDNDNIIDEDQRKLKPNYLRLNRISRDCVES